jgi:tRNA threonylcarbamoyladenosine biosynthesis protein TsaB
MKVLALSTSSARGSAALALDGEVIASACYEDETRHAERIFEAIDQVMADAGARREELGLLACDVGPGSFTGVRVGLATALGIARGLGVPMAGVLSLEAMAAAAFAQAPAERVVALLDARRAEVFVAVYARGGEVVVAPCHIAAGGARALCAALGEPAPAACGRVAASEGLGGIVEHASCELPSAAWIARLAHARHLQAPASMEVPEAVYLRPPDARLPDRPLPAPRS